MTSARDLFTCTQCGQCCRGYGGTFVSDEDIEAIARYLGISVISCKQRFCVPSGDRFVLAQRSDGYCIFWDQNCTIHAVKPRMCKDWPFIKSLLVDITNWHIMAASCPGMRDDLDDKVLLALVRNAMQAK